MAGATRNPLQELTAVQRRLNDLFDDALARTNFEAEGGVDAWRPAADVYETGSELVFEVELPGLSQNSIDVSIDGDVLTVEGERRIEHEQPGDQFHRVERTYGRFERRFRIPVSIDSARIVANYRRGVLTVRLSKRGDGSSDSIRVDIG